ncbi:MAG: hypothetical protein RL385_751 [Pseudomonadota bacterium]
MLRRLPLLVACAALWHCAEDPVQLAEDSSALAPTGVDVGAGGAEEPEPAAKESPDTPSRAAWLPDVDEVARVYPAHGVAQYHMAHVFEAPRRDARAVGYLRRGARFRASEEVSREGCPRGWFEIYGGGYVCSGDGVTVDSRQPPYEDAPRAPSLSEPLPYRYSKVMTADVPQFLRVPTAAEEQAVRTKLAMVPAAAVPAGATGLEALPKELASIVRTRMQPGFYVSLDRQGAGDDPQTHAFVRTIRGGHLRADLLVEGKLPRGLGVAVGAHHTLPLAFVHKGGAQPMRFDPATATLVKAGAPATVHSAHSLTGVSTVSAGRRYFETRDGIYLPEGSVRIVDKVTRPRQVPRRERWIRVDLDRQTLTAYEGDAPVFATLVSSGLPDHATPVGMFRLHAKHVTTTMADDMAADGPYSIEDVPWTMYFSGSYALHAAFWHDKFGTQRSHGCVNLAPRDARWLFFWAAPELPSAWHGVLAGIGQGTTVVLDTGVPYPLELGG